MTRIKTKPLTLAEAGRKGGLSKSPKKLEAIAKNLEKAREARLKDKNK